MMTPGSPLIGVIGDSHGNYFFIKRAVRELKARGVDTAIQVGDFGFWESSDEGDPFLEEVSLLLAEEDFVLYFVDGNHENHERLSNYTVPGLPAQIRTRLFHLPRGFRWEWMGKSFMSVGGAVSIDKNFRTPGVSWWPEEVLSEAELVRATSQGRVDYLFTHDAPPNIPARLLSHAESDIHRGLMKAVGVSARPSVWVHGHYHRFYQYGFPEYQPYSQVYGLSFEGRYGSVATLNILDGEFDVLI